MLQAISSNAIGQSDVVAFKLADQDFCIDIGRNICHGSDTVENAEKEIALWFPEGTNAWTSHSQGWIYE